jgi:5-oxoprolinase (ATP-hydrolysing) subunit A
MARVIDLNADVGEGVEGDLELLAVVTSASVACGFHAGDDSMMRALCEEAVAHQVAIGAHVGYRDREGFGRRELDVAPATIGVETVEQISVLQSHAAEADGRVAYVKPHGALYHRASVDGECAAAIASAIRAIDENLAVLGFPGSKLLEHADIPVAEGFADRGYAPDRTLIPRDQPGAVLGPGEAARQAIELARGGNVRSICLHGDTPDALDLARRVRAELETAGIELKAFA